MKILNWLTDVTMTLICYEKLDTCVKKFVKNQINTSQENGIRTKR